MVKRPVISSISEEDADGDVINENGKRLLEENKEKKKRVKTKSLYRQPTANELNRLQETESLFNSNLFRLQVEEVLAEVKIKEKITKRFQEWFTKLKNHLLTINEDDVEYDLSEKTFVKRFKVKLPICKKVQNTRVIFKFKKFSDVEIVGSYAINSSINSKLVVDLQITVPSETYTKTDSINYKYHLKRAAYIAYVVHHLKKFATIQELNYACYNGNESKPIINIKPKGKLNNTLTVNIDFVCEYETFKLHRFSPSRNNLREVWLLGGDGNDNADVGPATPHYNSTVLCDLTASINNDFLSETLMNNENLKQAIVLLKIWARQRKLKVSGYILSMLVAYLVQMKRINNIMSSYQIVRNVWIALKTSEWDTKGITLNKGEGTPRLEEFKGSFPVVFLDKTGFYNICWQMSRGTYDALRRESLLAVEMLDDTKLNSFVPLFMTPVSTLLQFDHIVKFRNMKLLIESVVRKAPKQSRLNYGIDQLSLVTNALHTLLCKGLTRRVDLVLPIVEADMVWPVDKTVEKAKDGHQEQLSFGLILNPENMMSIVDRGPPANVPEAEEFRLFWGDKSELRRFQDGTITEACVWAAESRAQRRALPRQIVDYLLLLKYDVPSSETFHVCDQLDGVTVVKALGQHGEEVSTAVLTTFDELRRDLRSLAQLPLDISAVNGTSAVFSYCEPLPAGPRAAPAASRRRANACLLKDDAVPRTLPDYVPANWAIVELAHSGKWPGDIEAFRCLKTAFHLQIAERLTQQYSLQTLAHPTHLDVLKDGLVFRLQVAHPKEVTLLRRTVERGIVKFNETEESIQLQCDTILMPRLRGALHGLHAKYPSFGPAACMFKRWVSAHLLAPHVPGPLCELLVAAVFVHCAPLSPPAQPTVAFLRVMRLLADTDWSAQMILLDFNNDMTREEVAELERKLCEREGGACVHVVTSYDGELPGVWGRALTPPVLARAVALARSTAQYLADALTNMSDDVLGAFVPSMEGYDVLIHLQRRLVPHHRERLDAAAPPPADPRPRDHTLLPVVEFDPVQRYLDELRHAYGSWAVFFHDGCGGDVVAVLWRPPAHHLTDLQISNANGLTPVVVDGETKYRLNKEALVEDFRLLGDGLVRSVQVLT